MTRLVLWWRHLAMKLSSFHSASAAHTWRKYHLRAHQHFVNSALKTCYYTSCLCACSSQDIRQRNEQLQYLYTMSLYRVCMYFPRLFIGVAGGGDALNFWWWRRRPPQRFDSSFYFFCYENGKFSCNLVALKILHFLAATPFQKKSPSFKFLQYR